MKTIAYLLIANFFIISVVNAQTTPWVQEGNGSTDPSIDFVGTTDDVDLRFRTDNTQRMCLTGTNGFLGLGTNSPAMLLHFSNGGLLSTGTTGTNPNLGAGTRFMWIPDRGAVRFGTAFDDEWDHPNVGLRSVAGGYLVLASGESSIGLGSQIEITGNTAFGLGGELNVSGLASGAVGKTITVTGNASYAVGCAIENDADFNITIGQGLSFATRLTNSIEHSLMVGFNSDSPTLFVGGGDGTVGSSGNVGIGNITAPTHRLDVNGTARLRVMPNDTANVLITGVQQDAVGDYELNYLDMSGNSTDVLAGDGTWIDINDAACEWNEITNVTDDLVMGYTGACNTGKVGIGLSVPTSKLQIKNTVTATNSTVKVESTGDNGTTVGHYGIDCRSNGGGLFQVAINGEALATTTVTFTPPNYHPLIGVRGIANAGEYCGHRAIGVYGEANGSTCSPALAGYFAGAIVHTQPPIGLSDQGIKINVESYSGGLNAVMALQPKTYNFDPEALASADPETLNYGFIAQDVQQVLPDLVVEVMAPLVRDEEGELIATEDTYLGIRYTDLIPVLVSAIQEQQAQIESLAAQVAACCTIDADNRSTAPQVNDIHIQQFGNRLEQNSPNPFETTTRISFNLAADCRARVCIYNSSGQLLDCLMDEFKNAGTHNLEWNTSGLASGIYFYSLEIDGFEQVKRAVKL